MTTIRAGCDHAAMSPNPTVLNTVTAKYKASTRVRCSETDRQRPYRQTTHGAAGYLTAWNGVESQCEARCRLTPKAKTVKLGRLACCQGAPRDS
jgi:hypothetical protein